MITEEELEVLKLNYDLWLSTVPTVVLAEHLVARIQKLKEIERQLKNENIDIVFKSRKQT